jgi:hypothetical protein
MERYSFPLLSPGDIFYHLKNSLLIPIISEDEITKPRFESLKEIYSYLLALCYQCSSEELLRPDSESVAYLRYPELYENTLTIISLYKHLSNILMRIGCRDETFGLTDLTNPDFKRTRKFLSAFVNYIRFMTEEQELIYDQNQECVISRIAAEEYEKTKDEYERLAVEVQALKKKRFEQQPIITQKLERVRDLEGEKNRLEDEKFKINNEILMLENDIKTCQETCARLNTLTENLKNEMSASMKEIVTNAEEVISLKNAANEQIELERLGFSEDQRKMIEQSGRVEIIDNLVTKLQEANLLLQPYETALTSYKSMKKNMKDLKKRSLELDGMIKKKQYSLTNLERSVRSSEDQFNRAQKQNESKMHSLEKILIDRQAEKQQLIFEKQSLERKINDLNDQLAAMQHELSNKKAEYETSLQTLENEHLKILKRAEEYRTIVIQMIQQCPFFGTKESLQS